MIAIGLPERPGEHNSSAEDTISKTLPLNSLICAFAHMQPFIMLTDLAMTLSAEGTPAAQG
jgi:hypothetical protein